MRPATADAVIAPGTSDNRLAFLASQGSGAAFEAIFERHRQALHRYCDSIVGNDHDAADALQNTMLRALRALPGDTREIALRPWLFHIAHNESISLLRARRQERDLEHVAELGDDRADAILETRERIRDLTADLSLLTGQQRSALLMRELGGLGFADVAGALGISAPAAKQSAYDARCALTAFEEGRSMDCQMVRRTLTGGDRRILRGLRIRSHLRSCASCQDYSVTVRRPAAGAAAFVAWLPVTAPAAWLSKLLDGARQACFGATTGATVGTGSAASWTVIATIGMVVAVGGAITSLKVAPGAQAAQTSAMAARDARSPAAPSVLPASADPHAGAVPPAQPVGDSAVTREPSRARRRSSPATQAVARQPAATTDDTPVAKADDTPVAKADDTPAAKADRGVTSRARRPAARRTARHPDRPSRGRRSMGHMPGRGEPTAPARRSRRPPPGSTHGPAARDARPPTAGDPKPPTAGSPKPPTAGSPKPPTAGGTQTPTAPATPNGAHMPRPPAGGAERAPGAPAPVSEHPATPGAMRPAADPTTP